MSWKNNFPKENRYFETNNGILYHADCEQLLQLFPSNSIDLILTSPPYANLRSYSAIHPDKYVEWFLPKAKEFYRILKPNGSFVLNIKENVVKKERHIYVYELVIALKKQIGFNFIEDYIWRKQKSLPNGRMRRAADIYEFVFHFGKGVNVTFNIDAVRRPYSPNSIKRMKYKIIHRWTRSQGSNEYKQKQLTPNEKGAIPVNVLDIASETQNRIHDAVFPEKLAEWFIKAMSNEGEIVLDPFFGSGTVGVVAEQLQRKWIGIELMKKHCEIAKNRILKNNQKLF